jgi:X-X-X-Leu-X-X-Gly heptad repeat protein
MAEMRIKGTIDTRNYERGVDRMKKKNRDFGGGLDAVKSKIKAAFAVGAIVMFVRRIGQAIANTVRFGSELHDLARQAGVSTDIFMQLSAAIEDGGGKQQDLANGLGRVRDAQGRVIDGDDKMEQSLARLGMTAEEFVGLSTEQAFMAISRAITEAGNSADAMNAAANILGQRGMRNLVNGMNQLASGADGASDGLNTLSNQQSAQLDAMGNSWRRFWQNRRVEAAGAIASIGSVLFGTRGAEQAIANAEKVAAIEEDIRKTAAKEVAARREEKRLEALRKIQEAEDQIRQRQAEEIGKIERSVKLEFDSDNMRRIGGFAGAQVSEQFQLQKQQIDIMRKLAEYNRSLPKIEQNTRDQGGLS